MGTRPSELYGITWPLVAFIFDKGVRSWANYVDRQVEQAEASVRMQMSKSKNRANVNSFALQAREVTFAKLMGQSTERFYSAPPSPNVKGEKAIPRSKTERKKLLDSISMPAEGRVDLARFN